MNQMASSTAASNRGASLRGFLRLRPQLVLLVLLAAQPIVFQLLTGAQYWDGPRNLHWGLVVSERPGFLLDQPDPYNWVNGFVPEPPSLAPAGMAGPQTAALHPWWGPLYVLLFAAVWKLTGSYTLLQLVVPLAATMLVLLVYRLGVSWIGPDAAMLAAALLALFPVFREHAPLSFVEPISALLITGALWAFAERRSWAAALLGALAMYGKVDLIFLYLGGGALICLLEARAKAGRALLRHALIGLGVPLLALIPWVVIIYGVIGRPATVGGGPSAAVFLAVAPQMVDQMLTLPRPLAVVTLASLVALAALGARALAARPGGAKTAALLGAWLALGIVVLLGYAALPGASNNPRVFIPSLPPLCLLTAAGIWRLRGRARAYTLAGLFALLLTVNAAGMLYQVLQARVAAPAMPAWELLRDQPRGAILTEHYWQAALFARQPVAWFEHDHDFERAIMHDTSNFRHYLLTAPIRYVVLPRDPDVRARLLASPEARLYQALPLGRSLGWSAEPVASPDVRAFLDATYPRREAGDYVIYSVSPDH